MAQYEQFFKQADKDNSGFLTLDELTVILKKNGYTDAKIQVLISDLFTCHHTCNDVHVYDYCFTSCSIWQYEKEKEWVSRSWPYPEKHPWVQSLSYFIFLAANFPTECAVSVLILKLILLRNASRWFNEPSDLWVDKCSANIRVRYGFKYHLDIALKWVHWLHTPWENYRWR